MRIATRALTCVLVWALTLVGADTRYERGKYAASLPIQMKDGLIYLSPRVNGAPPTPFVLDTGASHTVLNLAHARDQGLGLQPMGKMESGSGATPPEYFQLTDSVSFGLPGVAFSTTGAVSMSFDMLQLCFDARRKRRAPMRPGGIFGKDFFESHVVEIDVATRRLHLYDPASYVYSGSGEQLPLEIGDAIFVTATIKAPRRDAIRARLLVDTGASALLALTKEFVATNGLTLSGKVSERKDCGIGGPASERSTVGTMEAMHLGSVRISKPPTIFLRNPKALKYDGTLGGPALWGGKVIFDYSRHRMIVEPKRAP